MWSEIGCLLLALVPAAPASESGEKVKAAALAPRDADVRLAAAEKLVTASRMSKFGAEHVRRKEYAQAERLPNEALKIYQDALGADHPVCGWHLNMLGCLCIWTDRYERAEHLLQQARQIYQQAVGEARATAHGEWQSCSR